jgi:hypothetical protein
MAVKKGQKDISGLRDIRDHMDKIYGLEFSSEAISNIMNVIDL